MIDFVSKTNQVIYNAALPAGRMKMGECNNFSSWEGEKLDEGMKKHDISDFGVILWHSHKYDSRTDKACIDKLIILLPAELPGKNQRSK